MVAARAARAVARAAAPQRGAASAAAASAVGGESGALPPNLVLDDFAAGLMESGRAPAAAAAADYATEAVKVLPVLSFRAPGDASGASLTLDNRVFGVPIRQDLVHRVVLWQRANARRDYYATKTQSEVSGTGKKPHAQKKTGQARAGSFRSNLRRGGARVHGPVIRDWSQSLQKKGARARARGRGRARGGRV